MVHGNRVGHHQNGNGKPFGKSCGNATPGTLNVATQGERLRHEDSRLPFLGLAGMSSHLARRDVDRNFNVASSGNGWGGAL